MCGMKGDTITIQMDTVPTPELGMDTAYCKGFIFIKDATHNGPLFKRYRWSDGTSGNLNWVRKHGELSVEVTNKCGVGRDTVFIGIHEPLTIDLGLDTIICEGDTITLDPLSKEGTSLWSTGSTDSLIKVTKAGTYSVTVTNACGTYSASKKVEVETVPDIELPKDSILCDGDTVQLSVSYSRSSYKWQDGSTNQTFIVDEAGKYWVEVTNLCGMDRAEVEYKYEFPLDVELGADTILCDKRGFSKTLNLPGDPEYFWSTGSRTNVGQIGSGGKYLVNAKNVCGVYSDEIYVEQLYTPNPVLGNDTIMCQGETKKLSLDLDEKERKGSTITWQGRYNRDEFVANRTGVYWVDVTNVCGTNSDTIDIEIQPLPKVGLNNLDTNACNGKLIYDLREYPYEMLWQDGSSRKRYVIKEPGQYSVELWDELGCYSVEQFESRECPSQFWAPNAFTPNRDGKNETWRVYKTHIHDFELEVYNRWNELVFQSYDINKEWNGNRMNDGAKCPVGTYTFKARFKEDANKQLQEEIGQVNIVE